VLRQQVFYLSDACLRLVLNAAIDTVLSAIEFICERPLSRIELKKNRLS